MAQLKEGSIIRKSTGDEIIATLNDLDAHKADYIHLPYSIADGTDTYTTLINGISSLAEGMSIKIKFINANTGASTLNINGLGAIPIKKSNGNDLSAGNIKAGQICHLVYTGSVFQLLGEGGEYGTAQPNHVLEGITFGTEDGLKVGTMPNRGGVNQTLTTQGGTYTIPEGYHDGTGTVKAQFANLTASNIRDGVNIGGVIGTLKTLGLSSWSRIVNAQTMTLNENETRTVSFSSSGYSLIIAFIITNLSGESSTIPIIVRFNNKNLVLGTSTLSAVTITNFTGESITVKNTNQYSRKVGVTVIGVN